MQDTIGHSDYNLKSSIFSQMGEVKANLAELSVIMANLPPESQESIKIGTSTDDQTASSVYGKIANIQNTIETIDSTVA